MKRFSFYTLALGFALSFASLSHAETSELKATAGTLTPADPPKMQDRMEGSKAAAKAAAAGAATGKVNCMMLMNQARQESDKTQKMMLMFMANQQCQQASELEQSAAKNEESSKSLGMTDLPKQAKFEAGTTSLEAGTTKEVQIDFNEAAPSRAVASSSTSDDSSAPTAALPSKSDAKPEPIPQEGVNAQASPPPSALNPIAKDKVGFDDSSKGVAANQGLGIGYMPQGGSTAKNDPAAPLVTAASGEPASGRRRAIASDGGTGSGAEGSERSSGGGSGDEAMDALMSQLMGPDGVPLEEGMAAVGGQVWGRNDVPSSDNTERVNIFEYATVRYSKLKLEDKRLGGKAATPARSIASVKPL